MSRDPEKQTMVGGYWLVRASSDASDVNMCPVTVQVNVNVKSIGKNASVANGVTITIPILKNKKQILKGAELVVATTFDEAEAPALKRAKRAT